GFNHQNSVFGTSDHQFQRRILHLAGRGVQNVLAVDVTNASGTDRTIEGNAGDGQRGRCADHGRNVRVHLRVHRDYVQDDLHFVVEAFGEQRTQRAIYEARSQNFFLGRTTFTLEETARDT